MGSLITLLSNVAGIVSGWLGLENKKLDLKNAADMKQAAQASDEQKAKDKTAAAVAARDSDELRKELSE